MWYKIWLMEHVGRETGNTVPPLGREHVVVVPGYCSGKPHIAGHRIKVQHVAVWHERQGLAPDEIVAAHHRLTLGDVHAALTYYYDHRQQIDADIQEDEEFVAELEGTPSFPPSLLVRRLAHGNGPRDPLSPR
jgi:uncharacterized protein (DUF433 family)